MDLESDTSHGLAVYELDGDTLKLCYRITAKRMKLKRPPSLKTKPNDYNVLLVCKRGKR
jgi:hypothetical protein